MAAAVQTVVCIPTFKRPVWLRRCLESLADLEIDVPIRVIVADNDAEGRGGIAVCEEVRAEGYRHELEFTTVEHRGIAPTRNTLVRKALEDPGVDFIAMIDDDEWAEKEWLSELLRTQKDFQADVVGGPVKRVFAVDLPDYVTGANQPDYLKMKTGVIELVDATSNILFVAEIFRATPEPWFDLQYALMGCEDKDLLLGLKVQGKRFAWASRAIVTEEFPASRSSVKWMLQRAYRVGNTDTLVNLKHKPPGFNALSEGTKIIGALGYAAFNMSVMAWHPGRRFEGARLGARVVGKLVALTGGRHEEYKVTHGR